MLRRLLFLVPLVAFVLVVAPAAHAAPARDIAGVQVHPWRMEDPQALERTFAGVAATGVRWVRVDLRWLLIEPDGPALSSGRADWSEMDRIVDAAQRHGLELLPIVAYVPKWANDEHEWWAFPDAAPFEAFFEAALGRYPHITAWELWNEPNFGLFAKPQPDPARFVEFLRLARRVRDGTGSKAKLISGGLAPGMELDIVEWVDEMARLGGLELIDGLGVHPYSAEAPDDPHAWMMRLERLDKRLARLGRPDLELWLTEYGAPVFATSSGWGPPVSEDEQAERLRLAFALATRLPFVELLSWYEYRDSCGDAASPDCHFGLVREDYSPRPAYQALQEVTAGTRAHLRPRMALRSRHLSRRASRFVHVRGSLLLPGSDPPKARVTLRLRGRGAPTKTMRTVVRNGAFGVRIRRSSRRRLTIIARYAGSRVYEPVIARLRLG